MLPGHYAGQWEMYTHAVIDAAGAFAPQPARALVWTDGHPIDVPEVAGRRVVVLGPAVFGRMFEHRRMFPALGSDVELVRVLSDVERREWIARCAAQSSQSAP